MTKILIINSYTWYEKGDAAIIIGMLNALRQQFSDAEITILSRTPDVDGQHFVKYGDRIRVFKSILVLPLSYPRLAKAFNYLWQAIKYTLLAKLWHLKALPSEALRAYAEADLVISCGGGYLGGYHIGLLAPLYRIYLGKLLRKPVVLFCLSVEPCRNIIMEKATRFVLNRVDLIIVRERLSQAYLKRLGIKSPVHLGADAAFLLSSYSLSEANGLLAREGITRKPGELLVGVSVRDWSFLGYRGQAKRSQASNYFSVMVETVRHLISGLGAWVIFFPMVTYSPDDDDRILSRKMTAAVGSDRVVVLTEDYSPEEFKAMIGGMDFFITVRLHAAISAASMGIPTLAIGSEHRINGIMEMLGVGEYVLPVNNLRLSDVIAKINSLHHNRDKIRKILVMNTDRLKQLVIGSAQLVHSELR